MSLERSTLQPSTAGGFPIEGEWPVPAERPAGLGVRAGLVAALLALFTGIVYWRTLAPTFGSFDSAELIAGGYSLGIVHAPGYPLYMLAAHLAARLPFGTAAYNINLLSAAMASAATAVVFLVALKLSGSRWAAASAALVLAFSRLFWSQAVVAEVYTLSALWTAAAIAASAAFDERPGPGRLIVLSAVVGFSLSHHPSALLLVPGLAVTMSLAARRVRIGWAGWAQAALALAVPLSLYLYLPLRFLADPPLNYIGDYFDVDLASPAGLLWMVTSRMFGPEMFGRAPGEAAVALTALTSHLWLNLLGGGVLLALFGLIHLQSRPGLAVFFACGIAANLTTLAFYDVVDYSQMLLPALVLTAPPMAVGLSRVARLLEQIPWPETLTNVIGPALFMTLTALLISANRSFADRSADWQADRFGRAVMAQVEPNALVLAQWTTATPLTYLQVVEGVRPDVRVYDRGLLALAIRDRLLREGRMTPERFGEELHAALIRLVEDVRTDRPIYIAEYDAILSGDYCFVPRPNGIFRLLPRPCETGPGP